ncbi:hypothetical protein D3C84_1048420 [compost metagenome]
MAKKRGAEFVTNVGGIEPMAETLRQAVAERNPDNVHVSFCGPKALLAKVRELMDMNRIPQANLHVELFDFR